MLARAVAVSAEIFTGSGRARRRFVSRGHVFGGARHHRGHSLTMLRCRVTIGTAAVATTRRAGVSPRAA